MQRRPAGVSPMSDCIKKGAMLGLLVQAWGLSPDQLTSFLSLHGSRFGYKELAEKLQEPAQTKCWQQTLDR